MRLSLKGNNEMRGLRGIFQSTTSWGYLKIVVVTACWWNMITRTKSLGEHFNITIEENTKRETPSHEGVGSKSDSKVFNLLTLIFFGFWVKWGKLRQWIEIYFCGNELYVIILHTGFEHHVT